MSTYPIMDLDELASHLSKPESIRLIDCRFDLAKPEWGHESYLQAHIPGAVYADLNKDLSAPITPSTGRHPLPDPADFINKLAIWGVEPGRKVVVYDTVGGGFAGRLWWMLRAVGHQDVQMLNGSFLLWQNQKRPTAAGQEAAQPSSFKYAAQFNPAMYLTTAQMEARLKDSRLVLIDARAAERFQGLVEPIDAIPGHIPGAVNRFHGINLSADGTFKPAEQLRKEFTELAGTTDPENMVVYCGSGVTSCHHLVALEAAGITGVPVYIGSWSEWIRDRSRPMATGK